MRTVKPFAGIACILVLSASADTIEETISEITYGGKTFTNCTLRILNSTNGIITSGGSGFRVSLAELPEPWRTKYYNEAQVKLDSAEAERIREAKQAAFAAKQKAADEKEAAERAAASQPLLSNDWIEISRPKGTADSNGSMSITGILKSKAKERTLSRISIAFGIYDEQDNKIGEAFDFISSLSAGATWKFEAHSSKAGKFRLQSVKCADGRLD